MPNGRLTPVGSNPGNALFMPMNCVNTLPRPFCCVRLQIEALFDEAGVPASRVRKMAELLAEGQPQARQLLKEVVVGPSDITVSLPILASA